MAQRQMEMETEEEEGEEKENNTNIVTVASGCRPSNRKDKRKARKKEKRKKMRKEMAELARKEEESRSNDPEEQRRLQVEEEQEKLRFEKERREFEEREKRIMEEWERRVAEEQKQEEERKRAQEEERQRKQDQVGCENDTLEDGWEYVEDGPPEIIWQGNEIIVKKKKIKVKKKDAEQQSISEDRSRPTSNPLPPQSEASADHMNGYIPSAQELLQNVAEETPNFGTEQDKAHCPFHLKTGACLFGSRCSRIHFYPDKSCTLLMKNMYTGPGLAWEQDEGLEHTDEEVERAYEEFYEDVHTEFLKFGVIVNFKVCRNASSHLRGNVYVHYESLDSALLAYQSINGRYFGGKQVFCEFVGVTKWRVAICGEFMKAKLRTCSRGITCNFIHCFRNPGGDYEWADWDKPPPKLWLQQMAVLFGTSDGYRYDKQIERESPRYFRDSGRTLTDDTNRYQHRRSRSRENYYHGSPRKQSADGYRSNTSRHCRTTDRKQYEVHNEKRQDIKSNAREKCHSGSQSNDRDSNRNWSKKGEDSCGSSRKCFQAQGKRNSESQSRKDDGRSACQTDSDDSGHPRSRRPREKRREMDDGGHGSDLRGGDLPDEDSIKTSDLSDKPSSATHLNEMPATPAQYGDAKCCTHDPHSTGHCSQPSPRSTGSEEIKDKRSKRRVGRDSVRNCDGEHDHVNTSKRNRKGNELLDSETRGLRHGGKRSHVGGHKIYEATEGRDSWEPGNGDFEEHQEFDFQSDRWEPNQADKLVSEVM